MARIPTRKLLGALAPGTISSALLWAVARWVLTVLRVDTYPQHSLAVSSPISGIVFATMFSDSSWWQVFYDDGNEYLVVYREGTFSITSLADRSIAPQVPLNPEP